MLRYLFNDTFIRKLSERITQEVSNSLEMIVADKTRSIEKSLQEIRFDLKRIDEKMAQNQFKQKSDFGMLNYRVQNIENNLRQKTKEREANH